MNVAEWVGHTLAGLGVRHVFGVVASGNHTVSNALVAAGARHVAARHENGAAAMAGAYARMSDEVAAVIVGHGSGVTNGIIGIAEAARSRTPLIALAAEATTPHAHTSVDQMALAAAVGARIITVTSPERAPSEVVDAYQLARHERRTVLLNLPVDVQTAPRPDVAVPSPAVAEEDGKPDVSALVDLLAQARRPVLIAGRGARHARAELFDLGDACGALLATSAVTKGLFNGNPWSLDVAGAFASPVTAELIAGADVVVGFGCSLDGWTTRHGELIGPQTKLAQVDLDADALGRHQKVDVGIAGDSAACAAAVAQALWSMPLTPPGYRAESVMLRIKRGLRWRDIPYDDWGGGTGARARIDPRTLTIALDDLLPTQRVVAVDAGNFMGYPSMFLSVPDESGFCFTQSFQPAGLGLASAIGAALAQPHRLPVAALGDSGVLMSAAEFDTVRRLGLPMVVIVYNDAASGAEADTDIAAVAAGYGFESVTVPSRAHLNAVRRWLDGPRDRPLLLDAKVAVREDAWWRADAASPAVSENVVPGSA